MFRPVDPPGPLIPGISQAMLIEGGRLLVLSGHVPFDGHGGIVPGGVGEQLDQVFRNMRATLQAAGGDLDALVKITLFVRDYHPDQLPVIRSVRDRWIDTRRPPASSLVGVSALVFPELLIEVEGLAVLPIP